MFYIVFGFLSNVGYLFRGERLIALGYRINNGLPLLTQVMLFDTTQHFPQTGGFVELNRQGLFINIAAGQVQFRSIDAFFDNVLVNTDDEALRNNRLSILHKIKNLFFHIADFSKIVVEG